MKERARTALLLAALAALALLLVAFVAGGHLRAVTGSTAARLLLTAAALLAALRWGAGRAPAARRRALAWAYLAASTVLEIDCDTPLSVRRTLNCTSSEGRDYAAQDKASDALVRAAFLAARVAVAGGVSAGAGSAAGGGPPPRAALPPAPGDPMLGWLAGAFLGRTLTEAGWLAGLPLGGRPFSRRAFVFSPDLFQVIMLGELFGNAPAYYALAVPLKVALEAAFHWTRYPALW